jgi:hypothetical protein
MAALLIAGCGDDAPSEESRVREALQTFSRAVETRDYQTLCDEVFAPELLEGLASIGLPCEIAMRTSLGRVREPRLTVGEVTVDGTRATAEIRTSAQGQPPSSDTLELRRIEGRWRVTALGGGDEGPTGPTGPSGANGPTGPTGAGGPSGPRRSPAPTATATATPRARRTAKPTPTP